MFLKGKSSIYVVVFLACDLFPQRSAFILLWGVPVAIGRSPMGHPWDTARRSSDHLVVIYGWPTGDLRVTARRLSFYRRREFSIRSHLGVPPVSHQRTALLRSSACVFFCQLHPKFQTVSHGSPSWLQQASRGRPTGEWICSDVSRSPGKF